MNVKLKHLDEYCAARREVANAYDEAFTEIEEMQTPAREKNSTHVFHQYTLQVATRKTERDALMAHLQAKGVPSAIYYPVPLYRQIAFAPYVQEDFVGP